MNSTKSFTTTEIIGGSIKMRNIVRASIKMRNPKIILAGACP